jgi:hypothetical protein
MKRTYNVVRSTYNAVNQMAASRYTLYVLRSTISGEKA